MPGSRNLREERPDENREKAFYRAPMRSGPVGGTSLIRVCRFHAYVSLKERALVWASLTGVCRFP